MAQTEIKKMSWMGRFVIDKGPIMTQKAMDLINIGFRIAKIAMIPILLEAKAIDSLDRFLASKGLMRWNPQHPYNDLSFGESIKGGQK